MTVSKLWYNNRKRILISSGVAVKRFGLFGLLEDFSIRGFTNKLTATTTPIKTKASCVVAARAKLPTNKNSFFTTSTMAAFRVSRSEKGSSIPWRCAYAINGVARWVAAASTITATRKKYENRVAGVILNHAIWTRLNEQCFQKRRRPSPQRSSVDNAGEAPHFVKSIVKR